MSPTTVQAFFSTVPSGIITLHSLLPPPKLKRSAVSSTVIWVVVAAAIRPDLLSPCLTGSFTAMTLPGLTIAPASIDVEKLITSDSCSSEKTIALARRWAWPLDVQPKLFTCL